MIDNFVITNRRNIKIRGVIHKPDCSGKVPCVIFCHGFTDNRIEHHFMFVNIARALEKLNIAAVRFDFTGSGESDGDFKDMTITTEVEDCEAILEFCKNLDYIDEANINILGFSMGGTIAIITSAKHPDVIKNSILISPATDMYGLFISEVREDKLDILLGKNYVNFDGNLLSKTAIDDAFNYKVFDYVRSLQQNVIIIHGTKDESVPPMSSKKIEEILKDKAQLKFIKGAGHCYSEPEHDAEMMQEIINFATTNIVKGKNNIDLANV